ncbi:MAG: hypothetical protein D3909_09280 [Candidatus Electrothrix sp. ATG1]|nr:hypothetical protein [Candidatus Electrothrix sp. ATG1]
MDGIFIGEKYKITKQSYLSKKKAAPKGGLIYLLISPDLQLIAYTQPTDLSDPVILHDSLPGPDQKESHIFLAGAAFFFPLFTPTAAFPFLLQHRASDIVVLLV